MRAVAFAVLLAACAADAGGEATSNDEIQGGHVAQRSPAVGLLVGENGEVCTGTIVAPRWVLTAAHCSGALTDFYVGDGAPIRELDGDLRAVLATMRRHPTRGGGIAHPSFVADDAVCPTNGPDVALVELASPIADIAPVAIAPLASSAAPAWCQAIGFGIHFEDHQVTYAQKRWDTERVDTIAADTLRTTRVAGQAPYGITVVGDSGGPLFCSGARLPNGMPPPPPSTEPRGALIAVTSCGRSSNEGFYALLGPVMDWIAATTRGEVVSR